MTMTQRIEPKSPISIEEMERRREAVRQANAHNRIEGIMPDPDMESVFEDYIRGEIDTAQILKLIKQSIRT